MDIDELEEVITSLRVPNGWLVRAEALAPMLSSVPELGAAYGSNTSRSAVLRLALIRGLLGLEALVSPDGYGPWVEVAPQLLARHDHRGLWFVRIRVEPGGCSVSSNLRGQVHHEGTAADPEAAMALGDQALQRNHDAGEFPAHLPSPPLRAPPASAAPAPTTIPSSTAPLRIRAIPNRNE